MTSPWALADFDDHEAIHSFTDAKSGLKAIVAVHSTYRGPSSGGVRFWHYAQDEQAMTDALRLSRGMSYKNALADLPVGGGKGVILADAARTKTPEMVAAFARAIASLNGQYVTAQDVGMSLDDMINIGKITPYVSGLPPKSGQAGGDPGPSTARGVYLGVKAAVAHKFGKDSMKGVHVAIQGVGSVGGGLARYLSADGAKLTLADVDPSKAQTLAPALGATVVDSAEIMEVEADVFCPCALGAILNEKTIPKLGAPIVAGGANNQLAVPDDGDRLMARGILYAPDYVINAGGIINVAIGYLAKENADDVLRRIDEIPSRLSRIWLESEAAGENPATIADREARRLIGRKIS